MNLTTRQVADKLGVHISTVRLLAKEGKLGELILIGNGKIKKHYLLNSKFVNEYLASNKPVRKSKKLKESNDNTPSGLLSRLISIEEKLDKIIKMWL